MELQLFTQLSIDYANQRNYLDNLFNVYPTIPNWIRNINDIKWWNVETFFNSKDNSSLVKELLSFELFPIKDSYVSYLKRDNTSIERNPKTINRLAWILYEMWLDKIYDKCSEPKETNRQIGPLFKRWVDSWALWLTPLNKSDFLKTEDDAILSWSDEEMKNFAKEYLWYKREKWLDFIWRFNWKYVIGEAKFLTDFWGHQNAQFEDAISTIKWEANTDVVKIAILDWVCYIKRKSKMYKKITEKYSDYNIISALVLREFLYSL